MGRLVRSKRIRKLLRLRAGNRCELCDTDLEEVFHVDHIVPWSLSGDSSLSNLQALCPQCNLRKGNRMAGRLRYDRSKMRRGVAEAVKVCVRRMAGGKRSTCIVAPCRYGKSDMIRMSTLEGIDRDSIAIGVVLLPAANLVQQIIDPKRVNEMLERYEVEPRRMRMESVTARNQLNRNLGRDADFLSMTIQLASSLSGDGHAGEDVSFIDWCHSVYQRTGKRVGIFVDECHYVGIGNTWGAAVDRLVASGTCAASLYTASPLRSNNERMACCNYVQLDRECREFNVYRQHEDPTKIERVTFEGEKVTWKLVADYEITLKQAMDESPAPLCMIHFPEVDVNILEYGDTKANNMLLTDVERDSLARGLLSRACRDKTVVKKLVEIGLRELDTLHRSGHRWAGAMTFCGNDRPDDPESDAHLNLVHSIIRDVCRDRGYNFRTVVATSNEDRADEILDRFARGDGDILLVKSMAAVGFDASRVKVGIDISPVRTYAACMQRIFRVATPHALPNGETFRIGRWVTINDPYMASLRKNILQASGSESFNANEECRFKGSEVIDKQSKEKPPGTEHEIDGADEGNSYDIHGNGVESDISIIRNQLSVIDPEVANALSRFPDARVAHLLRGMCVPPVVEPEEPASEPDVGGATHNGREKERANAVFNAVKNIEAGRRQNGRKYEEVAREVDGEIKRHGGIGGVSLNISKGAQECLEVHTRAARAALQMAVKWGIGDGAIVRKSQEKGVTYDYLNAIRVTG